MFLETLTKTIEINRRHPIYKALRFVCKARAGKDNCREILHYLRLESKDRKRYIYAADGYRLHIAHITDKIGTYDTQIPDGIYTAKVTNPRIELEPINIEGTYPNVWLLIPADYPKITTTKDSSYPDHAASIGFAQIIKAMGKGCFNFHWFEDISPEDYQWDVFFSNHTSPILFTYKDLTEDLIAVIMPICVEV